ncbi:MAG: hypothetical protein HQM10_02980 [Candidatus Riflebacteria bacterium]|nr:hypothetical protein [Candidatus Riflebacteria bacterium]
MINKVELKSNSHHEVFGNPAPLGLIGLSVACSALIPISLGFGLTKNGLITAGLFALLFGACCQFLAGMMDFANKNSFGGTIFTAFSFNWAINGVVFLGASYGYAPDHHIMLGVETTFLVIFVFLTYGFGHFSKLFFFFLLDIDFLYICKILKNISGAGFLDYPIALFTILLTLISIWLTLATLMNPVVGRELFKIGGPMFFVNRGRKFDWTVRKKIFEVLFLQWRDNAFKEMTFVDFEKRMKAGLGPKNTIPELYYLMELGAINLSFETENNETIKSLRLTSSGIDLYEQLILRKYEL